MRTLIFSTAIRILTPVFLLFSVYILFRGHNHPGGGFIGGLIGAIAFVFHVLGHGQNQTNKTYFIITIYKYDRKPHHSKAQHVFRLIRKNIFSSDKGDEARAIWSHYLLMLRPTYLMGFGLLVAVGSGLVGLWFGKPFMSAFWFDFKVPIVGSLGTPLLFDTGVYLLVMGMVLKIVFTMAKE